MKREPGKGKVKEDKDKPREGESKSDKAGRSDKPGSDKPVEKGRRDEKPSGGKKQSLYSRLKEELKTSF
jgi:hypothetical protein